MGDDTLIKRTVGVKTEAWCDECGKYLGNGSDMSIAWTKYFLRIEGATTGKKIICKECRIKNRQKKCALIKKNGIPEMEEDGTCKGFKTKNDDRAILKCQRCVACSAFDWEEERQKIEDRILNK